MDTLTRIESRAHGYPNPYIYTSPLVPSATAYRYALTPTGRISKAKGCYQYAVRYENRFNNHAASDLIQLVVDLLEETAPKLPKGYTWGHIILDKPIV